MKLKIVAISDTHCLDLITLLEGIEGDLLIHCGDLTNIGSFEEIFKVMAQLEQVAKQFTYGVVITLGNHDTEFENHPLISKQISEKTGIHILIDEGIEINGLKIWASPYTPRTNAKSVFQYPAKIGTSRWGVIPKDLDILITHGPPAQILDKSPKDGRIGCWDLRHEVMLKQPKLHFFGHVHADGGQQLVINGVKFYNCCVYHWATKNFNGVLEIDYTKTL